ncbi:MULTISPECIES: hypothetical protein [Pseudomonas]|uniref:hypothetical protein n=1 Tax=Pseudomonas TaxID=286 RepID=UPI0002DE1479|nr:MULTISPECIES: hypothetical protein [Pseudomonas]MBW5413077.1 hypothetical protein [Pseudomonas sp. MAG002Y]RRW41072.1 hypothetical protein EGJ52_20220 [Pseudomonas luteola]
MNEKELIAIVTRAIDSGDLPDFSPSMTGALLFETLVEEWDALSEEGRGNLMLVLSILAKELSSEAKAERETQKILDRLRKG